MRKSSIIVGEIRKNNLGQEYTIDKYTNGKNIQISFIEYPYTRVVTCSNILMGKIRNPYCPSVYGVGFLGEGHCSSYNRKIYNIWTSMLQRCYCETHNKKYPSYSGCYTHKDWHNFQNFYTWYKQQTGSDKGWHLDKDILVKGNREYGPNYCAIVPQEINSLFIIFNRKYRVSPLGVRKSKVSSRYSAQIGKDNKQLFLGEYKTAQEAFMAYKEAKELHIREVAEYWKDRIDQKVYLAMLKYEITIDF